jgi:hypothetical protein
MSVLTMLLEYGAETVGREMGLEEPEFTHAMQYFDGVPFGLDHQAYADAIAAAEADYAVGVIGLDHVTYNKAIDDAELLVECYKDLAEIDRLTVSLAKRLQPTQPLPKTPPKDLVAPLYGMIDEALDDIRAYVSKHVAQLKADIAEELRDADRLRAIAERETPPAGESRYWRCDDCGQFTLVAVAACSYCRQPRGTTSASRFCGLKKKPCGRV